MRRIVFFTIFFLSLFVIANAKTVPTVDISFDAVSSDAKEMEKQKSFEGSAPIEVTFNMELYDVEGWTYDYEWRFCHEGGTLDEPYMIRYDEAPHVTFTQAGTDSIALYITFRDGTDEVPFKRAYWTKETTLTVKTSESSLIFPNAFTPNHDERNDTYKPKSYQSIIEFKAMIFNRWGQKMYEWDDVSAEGWDGTFHGSDVKEGTYFVYVKARGADGRKFEIKKDVNLLRSYNEYESVATPSE